MTTTLHDPLPVAVDRLAWALTAEAGAEDPGGLGKLGRALVAIEDALARHAETAKNHPSGFGEPTCELLPLWPVARQVAELRREHGALAHRARRLRRWVAAAQCDRGDPAPADRAEDPAILGRIFREADGLLQAIKRHQRAETDLEEDQPAVRSRTADTSAYPTAERSTAFLDAVCPRCEQRGMELVRSPEGGAVAACVHCGYREAP